MALLINCYKCGQIHLDGNECRPEALFNKQVSKIKAFEDLFKIPKDKKMKKKDFKDLLKSIDQVRKIHKGKMKAKRITKFNKGVK